MAASSPRLAAGSRTVNTSSCPVSALSGAAISMMCTSLPCVSIMMATE